MLVEGRIVISTLPVCRCMLFPAVTLTTLLLITSLWSQDTLICQTTDFGSIENANHRTQLVYVPEDWCTLVERVRSKNPFYVVRMKRENFVSVKNIRAEIVHRKVNTKKKVEWLNIRWIELRKEKPFQIQYRYSHNSLEAWKILNVQRKWADRPDPGRIPLERFGATPHPINTKKITGSQSYWISYHWFIMHFTMTFSLLLMPTVKVKRSKRTLQTEYHWILFKTYCSLTLLHLKPH